MDHLRLWLIRHGETAWSRSGVHTSYTDIPLTPEGERQAEALRDYLQSCPFNLVLTSPMQRARQTCNISGYGDRAVVDVELAEWNYGIYEGKSTQDIREKHPGWSVWKDEILDGESLDQVGQRALSVIQRCLDTGGDIALFAHAHILRILAACWLQLPPEGGRLFLLNAGSLSLLGYERETRVILNWNRTF